MQKVFSTVLIAALALAGSALAQTFTLKHSFQSPAPAPRDFNQFGFAVAAVGNNVLVGEPNSAGGGSAYLFDGNTGAPLLTFTNPTAADGELFGRAVAGAGNNVLIGAPVANAGAGAAYLFDGTTGALLHTFTIPSPTTADLFGWAVAGVGNNLLIGAPGHDTGSTNAGAAYLFDGSTGALLHTFLNPTPTPSSGIADQFGKAVAGVGNNAIIGAPGDDTGATNAGAAYLFDGSTGDLLQTFTNPFPSTSDQLGSAVAGLGNNVLVGAPFGDTRDTDDNIGAAYLYDGATGGLLQTFLNPGPPPSASDQFGFSVAAFGSNILIVVGAPFDAQGATDAGAAYLFDGSTGSLLQTIFNPTPDIGDQFGFSVAAAGNSLIIGAPTDDDDGVFDAGSAYLYSSDNQPPLADAGADQNVECTSPTETLVTLDGSASTDPDNDQLTYTWRENGNIIAGPTTSATVQATVGIGSHSIELTVIDEAHNMATDQVMVTVGCPLLHPFVLLAEKKVTIDHELASAGDIHSNDKIEFRDGNPSIHTGNLTAVGDITIKKNNTIDGDVTAGKNLALDGSATITGTATSMATVEPYPLPTFSFTDGADNVTVPPNGSLSLAPGFYHDVKVEDGGTLSLNHNGSSGEYFFHKLELRTLATLSIDVSQGPVKINLVEKFHFEKDVKVVVTPAVEVSPRFVTFNVMGDRDLHIHERSNVSGNINAPNAKIILYDGAFFKGAIAAKEIEVQKNVTCLHHDSGSSTSLAKISTSAAGDAEESDESVTATGVKGYALEQNYPNPFNPTTEIRFQLPEASHVIIKIFNTLGENIRTLVDGDLAPGTHAVRWNARNNRGEKVPSGMYFYRLVTPGFTETKRMILAK